MVIIGDIEIKPLAAESMGIRSMCTKIVTPDLTLVLDPSAALSGRYGLEPHPDEYRQLELYLQSIFVAARSADVLSVSHYHYDHVRPGFTNFRYNFSSLEELQRMFEGKIVLAKDNRENINASQRRRGFYFERDIKVVTDDIRWADGQVYTFGATTLTYSPPLPHGPDSSELGYVLATTVTYGGKRFLFVPDVQGPVDRDSLSYCLSVEPDVAIVGGPPIYLSQFQESHRQTALYSLVRLASSIPVLAIDHHLIRSPDWETWISPVREAASRAGNSVLTMAELTETNVNCMEAHRKNLYADRPPDDRFMRWVATDDEYKEQNRPPID
jgi:predicted metallo-beta-lactamase superfamily hydrolase